MNIKDKFCRFIAWHLPKRIVEWAFFRVMAHATSGKYSGAVVPDIKAMKAIERWY